MPTRQINIKVTQEIKNLFVDRCSDNFISHIELLIGFIEYVAHSNDVEMREVIELLKKKR